MSTDGPASAAGRCSVVSNRKEHRLQRLQCSLGWHAAGCTSEARQAPTDSHPAPISGLRCGGNPYDDDDDLGNRSPETVTDFRVVVNYVPEMPPPWHLARPILEIARYCIRIPRDTIIVLETAWLLRETPLLSSKSPDCDEYLLSLVGCEKGNDWHSENRIGFPIVRLLDFWIIRRNHAENIFYVVLDHKDRDTPFRTLACLMASQPLIRSKVLSSKENIS